MTMKINNKKISTNKNSHLNNKRLARSFETEKCHSYWTIKDYILFFILYLIYRQFELWYYDEPNIYPTILFWTAEYFGIELSPYIKTWINDDALGPYLKHVGEVWYGVNLDGFEFDRDAYYKWLEQQSTGSAKEEKMIWDFFKKVLPKEDPTLLPKEDPTDFG